MPAALRDLRARREAARTRRRRRRAAFVGGAALLGSGALAVAVLGGGGEGSSEGSVESPASVPTSSSTVEAPPPPTTSAPAPATAEAAPPPLGARLLAGQRLIAGYDGVRPPAGLRRMIRRGELAGVILFDDNVAGSGTTRQAVRSLQRIRRPQGLEMPLLVMVDQEGGLVKRLPGAPRSSATVMGARGGAYARRQGRAAARGLRDAGINVDLAPVLDVGRPGSAIASEGRSFAAHPRGVIEVGVRGFARGLQDGGVAATAKHFPGLGGATTNTDEAPQRIELSRRALRGVDERPFEAFIGAEGDLVMLGLATYPAFSNRPAALSRAIATGELRRRLGFEGVSISDSLDATAARSFGGRRRIAVEAARAGTDLLLYGDWRTARTAGRALRHRLLFGALDREAFERSVERVLELRRSLPR